MQFLAPPLILLLSTPPPDSGHLPTPSSLPCSLLPLHLVLHHGTAPPAIPGVSTPANCFPAAGCKVFSRGQSPVALRGWAGARAKTATREGSANSRCAEKNSLPHPAVSRHTFSHFSISAVSYHANRWWKELNPTVPLLLRDPFPFLSPITFEIKSQEDPFASQNIVVLLNQL